MQRFVQRKECQQFVKAVVRCGQERRVLSSIAISARKLRRHRPFPRPMPEISRSKRSTRARATPRARAGHAETTRADPTCDSSPVDLHLQSLVMSRGQEVLSSHGNRPPVSRKKRLTDLAARVNVADWRQSLESRPRRNRCVRLGRLFLAAKRSLDRTFVRRVLNS